MDVDNHSSTTSLIVEGRRGVEDFGAEVWVVPGEGFVAGEEVYGAVGEGVGDLGAAGGVFRGFGGFDFGVRGVRDFEEGPDWVVVGSLPVVSTDKW